MKIRQAEFVISSSKLSQCPESDRAEFAFIGRSNVGKSSLINMLCDNSSLAKTSSTPGKTQLINHFLINKEWYLVDLPGYGYAKVSQKEREKWQKMINNYLLQRENLLTVFVLVDSRLEPQKIDIEFINFLGENAIPLQIIFTKTDKQSNKKTLENIEKFKDKLLETWEECPKFFASSSVKAEGKEEILNEIEYIINEYWK
ncbi:MAG: YihA family ribosome biogenesis GTP-binding protein [Bacteroidales bacterium]|nr:YihA family ribosome biogenesis GTP-binding protein [Bacteroidales bacterium]MBQ9255487.1 YihA family ribosome biogenesis GTP-binding protein [Bacteroidales bacterium]